MNLRRRSPFMLAGASAALLILSSPAPAADAGAGWQTLERGLAVTRFATDRGPEAAIIVVRIDPALFDLQLFNASAEDNTALTPRQWSRRKGLVAVINASMFQQDGLTSVSLMRTEHHVNNAYVSKDNTILGLEPREPDVPPVKIIDRKCDDLDTWQKRYKTVIQSIRMISCEGKNVWQRRTAAASTSALALDVDNNVLFIHSEPELTTTELIDILLALPLHIDRAMYLEGGPQAQLYVDSGSQIIELSGRFSSILGRSGGLAWPIPNVIGVLRKSN